MKIACLIFISVIVLVNVIAGLRQAWILFRKKIYQCPGRIVASRIGGALEQQDGDNKLNMFWPEVEYEYEPAGPRMTGNRISLAFVKTSVRAGIERQIAAYPVGDTVRVFYNADDVTEAYLKDPRKHIWTSLAWAFGMVVFGVLMNWMIWTWVP